MVITGSQVETGAALIKLEQLGDGTEEAAARPAPTWTCPRTTPLDSENQRARSLAAMSAVVLGYDVPPEDQDAALSAYLAVREQTRQTPSEPTRSSLLETFADLAELTRNRPLDEDRQTELRVHSSREHFHTYLQSLDAERGGLPAQFKDRLTRVLRHYGVEDPRPHACAGGRGLPHLPGPAADDARGRAVSSLLGSWSRETPPTGPLAARAREPAGAARPGAAGALPRRGRPGPQRPLPLVRPAGRGRRALLGAARCARRGRGAGRLVADLSATEPPRIEALASIPEQTRRLPVRVAGVGDSRARAECSRCWRDATTASTPCTTCTSIDASAGEKVGPRPAGRHG